MEHILLFLIVIFLFYHFLENCGCVKEINGFSVGSIQGTCRLGEGNQCLESKHSKCIKYGYDLTPLNLNPVNGSVIYEIKGDPKKPLDVTWTLNGEKKPLTTSQLLVLNCLQEQLKIRYIGVKKQEHWYKYGNYTVLAGINAGEKGVNLYFSDNTLDSYKLSIHDTSILIHDTNYKSDNPTIIYLIVSL